MVKTDYYCFKRDIFFITDSDFENVCFMCSSDMSVEFE